jgi:anti-sigma factor RsiW
MSRLICLWIRPLLERYADGALAPRVTRSVKTHLTRCQGCLRRVERLARLETLVRSAVPEPAELGWEGFWEGIQARILREAPRPMRDPWWIPLWKPFWGHPRLAMGGVMVTMLAAVLLLWPLPGREGQGPVAWAEPVVVQDVGTSDPGQPVMVYSTPDQALTVIWLFTSDGVSEES